MSSLKKQLAQRIRQQSPPASPLDVAQKTVAENPVAVADTWPKPPSVDAFYGLAGEFVTLVAPHTEADPVALLLQFLVGFGNVIGRSAHFAAESHRHFGNLFLTLVGNTSKGRKCS